MGTSREIEGLISAKFTKRGMEKTPVKNFNASQKAGLRFEKKVGKLLVREFGGTSVYLEQWISYSDRNGLGLAQPDGLVLLPDKIIIVECKLTQTDSAWGQINELYLPLLRHLYPNRKVIGVQVFKRMRVVPSQRELIGMREFRTLSEKNSTLHLPLL